MEGRSVLHKRWSVAKGNCAELSNNTELQGATEVFHYSPERPRAPPQKCNKISPYTRPNTMNWIGVKLQNRCCLSQCPQTSLTTCLLDPSKKPQNR
jgi:hypothetical protein